MLSNVVGFTKMEKCQSLKGTIWRTLKNYHKSNVHSEHLDKMPFLHMAAIRAEGEARLKKEEEEKKEPSWPWNWVLWQPIEQMQDAISG